MSASLPLPPDAAARLKMLADLQRRPQKPGQETAAKEAPKQPGLGGK